VRIATGQTLYDGTNIYDDQTPSATLVALTNVTLRPVTYTVTFDINYDEGTNPEAQTVLLGEKATEPADPTREGYTFTGWDTDEWQNVRREIKVYATYKKAEQGMDDVQSDKVQCTKVIRDGQLLIIRDGKMYNVMGAEVR
jgi:uncharacterized repeat protein (TIGR02543 family)